MLMIQGAHANKWAFAMKTKYSLSVCKVKARSHKLFLYVLNQRWASAFSPLLRRCRQSRHTCYILTIGRCFWQRVLVTRSLRPLIKLVLMNVLWVSRLTRRKILSETAEMLIYSMNDSFFLHGRCSSPNDGD